MKKVLLLSMIISCCAVHAQFVLNGDAENIGGTCYKLTDEVTYSAGSIWYETLVTLEENFDINFTINLGDLDVNGADGVYFVLQPLGTGLGAAGGGMGYEGITPSVGVEFDTYQNGGYGDPAYDHIAITSDGNLNHTAATNLDGPVNIITGSPNAEDGDDHYIKITWDAAAQTLQAYVDCDLRVSYTGDIINDIFGGDPNVYFGFTGGTGSLFNYQVVCFDYITEIDALVDATVCPGDSVQLSVPEGFASYLWTPDTGISDNTIADPWFSPETTTTYTVAITDLCGFVIYDTVTVEVGYPDFVDLGPDLTLCDGQLWTFNVLTPGATYLWNDGSTGPTLTIDESGTYSVVVTDGACIDGDTISVNYVPAPDITLPEDTLICGIGSEYTIDVTTPGATYTWQDGSHEPTFTITDDGLYYVTVTIGGCQDKDSVLVSYSVAPVLDLGPDIELCVGSSLTINAGTPTATYAWQDGASGNIYTINGPGLYWVEMTINGCTTVDSLLVTPDPCQCIVTAPNVFSPNQDGVNDVFKQVDCDFLSAYHMMVYNRWGELVFETADYNGAWDGRFNGADCDVGTYVYTISYTRLTGESGVVQGNVILVR
ncbi:MAG: gliding motility-associated C-terminal domain-containing protein [Chitinophagales bacterium]